MVVSYGPVPRVMPEDLTSREEELFLDLEGVLDARLLVAMSEVRWPVRMQHDGLFSRRVSGYVSRRYAHVGWAVTTSDGWVSVHPSKYQL